MNICEQGINLPSSNSNPYQFTKITTPGLMVLKNQSISTPTTEREAQGGMLSGAETLSAR